MDRHMTLALDQHAFVADFNDTSRPYPASRSIVSLFQSQVDLTPEAEALRFGTRALSYQDLDRQSDHLAERLRAMGVGSGELVALRLEHSIEAVAAILGVLKTGAAYVPLAPATPPERLRAILQHMAPAASAAGPAVVAHDTLAAGLPDDVTRRLMLHLDAPLPAGENRIACPASPADLAYVIFTSGSTGRPKGVMIEHRSLVNYAWWAAGEYTHGEQTTWPLFSSLAFDLTVTSIFVPLITGGRIVVYRERPGARGTVVLDVVGDRLADVIKLTPAHLALLEQADLAGSPIRRFVVGGEDFKTRIARGVTERFGRPVEMYNEYGPTEATVGCMIHRYDPDTDRGPSVPIGRPAANAQVYVLDAERRPVAPGAVGEMYLGGDGLARGYFHQPALTALSFLMTPDPCDPSAPPVRLYKTGDLARWTDDGRIEFLGRADHQVKIGGFRIELGEIEAVLATHPSVSAAVVVVRAAAARAGEDGGPGHLAAYYVAADDLPADALRAHLARALPDYMVPALFMRLDRLPLTVNGKVDRAALPDPPSTTEAPTSTRPLTALEQRVVDVWRDVLGVEEVGVDDDFFALGGHSLAAMRVLSRIRDAFDVDLPLDAMFLTPTVARVAAAIADEQAAHDARLASPAPTPIPRLQPLVRPRMSANE
jgi:iturin family lipopeptide synthetase A/iturin family lipopeptide synthetase C/tyrocidine synthetase-3